jgi:hypothetical protein
MRNGALRVLAMSTPTENWMRWQGFQMSLGLGAQMKPD